MSYPRRCGALGGERGPLAPQVARPHTPLLARSRTSPARRVAHPAASIDSLA